MTLPLRPEVIVAAYDFLASTPPFHRWKLPPSDEVEFRVIRDPKVYGYHSEGDCHIIEISERLVGHTVTLLSTLAHELVHLHQAVKGTGDKSDHGPEFKKLAALVCRYHGFDPRAF